MSRHHGERLRAYDLVWLWLSRAIIWIAILITLFPILAVVFASFSPGDSFFHPSFFPTRWTLDNYRVLFNNGMKSDFVIWTKNTLMLAIAVAALTSVITTLAAYAYSRMKFPGRKFALMVVFLLQMFPAAMSIPALFGMLKTVNGLDSLWGLSLIMLGTGAFGIWMVKNFIDNIPRELDEAAMVDGAKYWTIFIRIIIPLAKPMIVVQFLWGVMGVINEYIMSAILLKSPQNYTIPLGLHSYVGQMSTKWGMFSAATLLSSVPVVILWIINQKWVQAGLTAGAVKG
ncbi:MAG: sugar ABC transporter permease [Mycobacterium leprae]